MDFHVYCVAEASPEYSEDVQLAQIARYACACAAGLACVRELLPGDEQGLQVLMSSPAKTLPIISIVAAVQLQAR